MIFPIRDIKNELVVRCNFLVTWKFISNFYQVKPNHNVDIKILILTTIDFRSFPKHIVSQISEKLLISNDVKLSI